MNNPKLSVIIPTFNRKQILIESLRCLDCEGSRSDFEVIVVCDGCTDNSAELVRQNSFRYPINLIEKPNGGSASARNRGAAVALAPVLLFIDDDMRAGHKLIDRHTSAHARGVSVVVGRMDYDPASPDTILGDYVRDWSLEFSEQLRTHGIQSGFDMLSGHISVDTAVFKRMQGFRESFNREGRYGNEDLDFGHRLYESGVKIEYLDAAQTQQYYGVTARSKFVQARDLGSADILLSKQSNEANILVQSRMQEIAKIDSSILNVFSSRWPRATYRLFSPLRIVAIHLIDRGYKQIGVHRLFGLIQALAYRAGVADASNP